MTTKDYETLAASLHKEWRVFDEMLQHQRGIGFRAAVRAMTVVLKDENVFFDCQQFYDAVYNKGIDD